MGEMEVLLIGTGNGGTFGSLEKEEADLPVGNREENESITNTNEDTSVSDTSAESTPRNITLMMWFMLFRLGGESIWVYSVVSAYLYLLFPEQPELVGYLSALQGLAQLLSAIVAGILGDVFGHRETLLKGSSFIGFVSSVLVVISCVGTGWNASIVATTSTAGNLSEAYYISDYANRFFTVLVVALAMIGLFDGVSRTITTAVFADSIPSGKRSYYFTRRFFYTTLGYLIGPVLGIVFFLLLGNEWTIQACATVMSGAQVFLIPAFTILCLFRDKKVAAEYNINRTPGNVGTPLIPVTHRNDDASFTVAPTMPITTTASAIATDPERLADGNRTTFIKCCRTSRQLHKNRRIAIGTAISDFLAETALGISFRYVTIFFLGYLRLSPAVVQLLDALSYSLGATLLMIAQRLVSSVALSPITRKKRSLVTVYFKVLGIVLLLVMIFLYLKARGPHQEDRNRRFITETMTTTNVSWSHATLVCMFYVLQNACFNCTQALTQSLMLDHVPMSERAKWSSLESFHDFAWCGSAAIGGWLVSYLTHTHKTTEDDAFLALFFVTAGLELLATLLLIDVSRLEENQHIPI